MLNLNYLNKEFALNDYIKAEEALAKLNSLRGKTDQMAGWLDLPFDTDLALAINETVNSLKTHSEYLVVIGIGGSYLGAKAAISFLEPYYQNQKILFAGFNLDEDYLNSTLEFLKDKDFSVNYISKSGTTTEPAIAFRLFLNLLKTKYPSDYNRHIVITTDAKSPLATFANTEKIKTYSIPSNVGGRFSVLSAVGLLPIAFAGFSITTLLAGAKEAVVKELKVASNSFNYALLRYNLYTYSDKSVEFFVSANERFRSLAEWWKQLFAESEGKDDKGLLPASLVYTTDLHSLGQFIQEGSPIFFETTFLIKEQPSTLEIPSLSPNFDNLAYLEGRYIEDINKTALLATKLAHLDRNVFNIELILNKRDEFSLGYLFMFFEIACAISGFMLDINPFDQPGVEMYKSNMFAFLDKPGFSEKKCELFQKFNLK